MSMGTTVSLRKRKRQNLTPFYETCFVSNVLTLPAEIGSFFLLNLLLTSSTGQQGEGMESIQKIYTDESIKKNKKSKKIKQEASEEVSSLPLSLSRRMVLFFQTSSPLTKLALFTGFTSN